MSTVYSISNLPSGFSYDSATGQLFNPVNKKVVVVNQDGTITNGRITFDNVSFYVQMHLSQKSEPESNPRDRVVEYFRADSYASQFCEMHINKIALFLLAAFNNKAVSALMRYISANLITT